MKSLSDCSVVFFLFFFLFFCFSSSSRQEREKDESSFSFVFSCLLYLFFSLSLFFRPCSANGFTCLFVCFLRLLLCFYFLGEKFFRHHCLLFSSNRRSTQTSQQYNCCWWCASGTNPSPHTRGVVYLSWRYGVRVISHSDNVLLPTHTRWIFLSY